MVSQSSDLAKLMVLRIDSLVSPGRPRMKSAWMVRPSEWQSLANWRARSTVAPFLTFLRICGSPDSKPTMSRRQPDSLHGLQRVVIGGDARGAAPGEVQGLELLAQLDRANLLDVERVVVEEEFLDLGEVLLGPLQLGGNIVCRPLAPGVPAQGLRPQAEGALRGAAAGGVERDVGMQQEGDVVLGHVHVALVDFGGPGHGVQVFCLRAVGVVDHFSVELVADAEDLAEGLALGKLNDRVIELAAADEVERRTLVEGFVRRGGDRRADKGDFDGGVGRLDGLGEALIALPADGGGEEDQEVIILADLDGLVGGDVVGVGIEQTRTLQHSSGVGQPDGVPVRLNLARGRPARTRAAVKVLERGRIQEKRFQGHRHPFNSIIAAV
jgi:hypothetical protein